MHEREFLLSPVSLSSVHEVYFESLLALAFLSGLFTFSESKNTVAGQLLWGSRPPASCLRIPF